MSKLNIILKDSIRFKKLNIKMSSQIYSKFEKIVSDVYKEINDAKKTLNVLNKNYRFSFKLKDINKFKKLKKKFIFLIILMNSKLQNLEKKTCQIFSS